MKNNKICIDMDSVLTNFLERTLEVYNEKYNTNWIPEDVTSWDIAKCLDCPKQQLYELWTPEFFLSVEPKDYTKQLFIDLKDMGYKFKIVTAYSAFACVAKTQWLGKYAGLSENDIIFCNDKYWIDADYRLDDRVKNFFDSEMEVIENCEHILFSQQYNLDGVEDECVLNNYYRVENLKEFMQIMRNFKE